MSQMAPQNYLKYEHRIERVRAHIRANLDEPLDLDTVAEVA